MMYIEFELQSQTRGDGIFKGAGRLKRMRVEY